jgi:putative molybdopterin biosynthesis protein
MSVYLHDVPLAEAQARFENALRDSNLWGILGMEDIPVDEHACGRVLAKPIWAEISSPHYHAAAMDGFAVRAEDTSDAMPNSPVKLVFDTNGGLGKTVYLDTGDPLPSWADAVIPIEFVEPIDERDRPSYNARHPFSIRIRAAVPPWSHIRPMGEDMVATQLVLPAGYVLRPVDLGAIAASGHSRITVARKPRVAILPTGTELVSIGQEVRPGDIIEYNSVVLAAQVNEWGADAIRSEIIPDDFEQLCSKVAQAALDSDLILLNAGSSAGSEDYSASVVEALGQLLVHGIAVRPGHPVIIGMVDHQKALKRLGRAATDQNTKIVIIGVPGYPVSAALTGEIFVEPLIALWLGRPKWQPQGVPAKLTRKITSPPGDDDYIRVAVGQVGDEFLAAPLSRGSGVITSLVHADGIVILPKGIQGLPAGAEVNVRLYRTPAELEQTIFAIGSHDLTLDLLAQFLARFDRRLVSVNVGSQAGLVALSRGEAHLAGSHLLDPKTGEYNISYIQQYLPGIPVKVISLVDRQQGLIVHPGNPENIHSFKDLTRSDVRFVNRQKGAGTRVLLDYHLNQLGIAPMDIRGYNQEEYTHLAVAAAISSGRANCGLGIAAAAQALNLDFVPLYHEKYELIIPVGFYVSELLQPLLALLKDENFRQAVAYLPGYDVSHMGELVNEVNGP